MEVALLPGALVAEPSCPITSEGPSSAAVEALIERTCKAAEPALIDREVSIRVRTEANGYAVLARRSDGRAATRKATTLAELEATLPALLLIPRVESPADAPATAAESAPTGEPAKPEPVAAPETPPPPTPTKAPDARTDAPPPVGAAPADSEATSVVVGAELLATARMLAPELTWGVGAVLGGRIDIDAFRVGVRVRLDPLLVRTGGLGEDDADRIAQAYGGGLEGGYRFDLPSGSVETAFLAGLGVDGLWVDEVDLRPRDGDREGEPEEAAEWHPPMRPFDVRLRAFGGVEVGGRHAKFVGRLGFSGSPVPPDRDHESLAPFGVELGLGLALSTPVLGGGS